MKEELNYLIIVRDTLRRQIDLKGTKQNKHENMRQNSMIRIISEIAKLTINNREHNNSLC